MNKADQYHERIMEDTGLTITEIHNLIKEKEKEVKGLISEEGILFIISKELGVDIGDLTKVQKPEMFIKDLDSGMKNIIMTGRVERVFELRNFTKKDGSDGSVLNFIISDKTGRIRVVLWDDLAVDISLDPKLQENVLVKIVNAYIKWSDYNNKYELQVPKWGKITFNPGEEDEVEENDFPKKIEHDWSGF